MGIGHALDALVRERLLEWPQYPPGLATPESRDNGWLRGRPCASGSSHPFLKLPGSNRLRTLPDGLWLNFGGTRGDPFVDIFAIEACTTLSNLLDKRSRFAPSTHSMLALCPVPWLLEPVSAADPVPRWRACGLLLDEPSHPLVLPVRDIRVLYGLKSDHYAGFARTQIPHPHEYFAPMEALTASDGHSNPMMQALCARASVQANFMLPP
jgi:hypothetical protein